MNRCFVHYDDVFPKIRMEFRVAAEKSFCYASALANKILAVFGKLFFFAGIVTYDKQGNFIVFCKRVIGCVVNDRCFYGVFWGIFYGSRLLQRL